MKNNEINVNKMKLSTIEQNNEKISTTIIAAEKIFRERVPKKSKKI